MEEKQRRKSVTEIAGNRRQGTKSALITDGIKDYDAEIRDIEAEG